MIQNTAKHNFDEYGELRGLFEKQLKELLWAEDIMMFMLKDITAHAYSTDLQKLLHKLEGTTSGHLRRLEKIFYLIGVPEEAIAYDALQCFIDEVNMVYVDVKQGVVSDAALIAALQKIKHYEIACYGTMRAYAIALREEEVVLLLEQTLSEEKEADLALSVIAESHINIEAADKEI
ncbi:DUF892 family protein [Flavobacterium sp. DG1-102-2]|uniref:YciE/YciF ferroxidase family protein n=1 Tax=Flavobacterium sp. DG1-102-2 TaxID=3081663 RepID=UPI002949D5B9|nr:DUF892 family protein [Flavobacterium sp. DG1-102-2]MDV6168766.1 DUF892 family protein [Flavobacterium sp. DG1-102-2]